MMKTRKRKRIGGETRKRNLKGGENTHLEKVVDKIIKLGMNYRANSLVTNNDFQRLFVHSSCFNDIARKLTKKIVALITPDNSLFQKKYQKLQSIQDGLTVNAKNKIIHANRKIQISLIALILHYAGLLYSVTNTANLIDLYEIHKEDNENEQIYDYNPLYVNKDANIIYSSWMVYNIFRQNMIFIAEAFNQNNITKIKAFVSRVPQIADAETLEMLTEYFEKEKPKRVEDWVPNLPPPSPSPEAENQNLE